MRFMIVGTTKEESEIVSLLDRAWEIFRLLPRNAQKELFRKGINEAKNALARNVVERDQPSIWQSRWGV